MSHSHDDKKIAAALVDVIEATMVPRERIICTSRDNPKYSEPEGVDVGICATTSHNPLASSAC